MWWVIHMCRGFDPLFSLWQDRARSFWGVFSHPPTRKRSFEYKSSQNSIFLALKYHFSLDLFGSNFQWPAAHPQQFSDRVPPPGARVNQCETVVYFRQTRTVLSVRDCTPWINSLGPSDAIWWLRAWSTLAQVMACCLTAPNHYLNQCWLIIGKIEWHSSKGKFTRDKSAINYWNYLEN